MRHPRLAPVLAAATLAPLAAPAAEKLSYNRDVRPLLSEYCFACHGPDANTRKGKLRLDRRDDALASEAFVPGDPDASEFIYRIETDDPDDLMPPEESHKTLTAEQIQIFKDWIAQGAEYEPHWAYIPPERPAVPDHGHANPVDNFIADDLAADDLTLSPKADANTLLRRLHLDLTGLPPKPADVAAFKPAETGAEIDSLLASPHFGERMAVFWLDLARYADSIGYHSDNERDVTPYRDYVIDAFNANKRYDTFVHEQLAGDLLEKPTTEQLVATSFNRVNQISGEGGIQDAEYIAKYYAERVRTTSVAFLGSTMGCAECHDHKFDPFTARDFYSMQAFFADIYEKGAYNGDGRYNEGANLKNYDHLGQKFSLSQWGPQMQVPTAQQRDAIAELRAQRNAAAAEQNASTPELTAAFDTWVTELRKKRAGSQPADVTILDDKELPLPGDAKTTTGNKFSGSLSRVQQSGGLVQHIVNADKKPVTLAAGDVLFAHVFLDPKNPPKQIMLQFHEAGSGWNHRAYWGGDHIPYGQGANNAAHRHRGDLPELGKWVRIEVPAADVGLPAGKKITQYAFTQFGGKVFWDLSGRHTADPAAALAGIPDNARKALEAAGDKPLDAGQKNTLLAHFRTITPLLAPARDRVAKLDEQIKQAEAGVRHTLVSLPATPRDIRILPRGDWMDKSGEIVQPAFPSFLSGEAAAASGRLSRLDLARWITAPDNPLTARAFVNRLWNLFLGDGLSRDLQDLGNQGQWPTHPELLDWLAVEFVESGWDVKHMVKLIVSSDTYQQNSVGTPELLESDPYNKRFARQSPRRLEAEFVRDNALAAAGLLNTTIGGASARPYQPAGYYANLNFPKRTYKQHNDDNQYRRGLYMHWQRTFLHPMLIAFDAPPREECTADRPTSNTPLQALDLLNDPTFVEAARVLAQHLMAEKRTFAERLDLAFAKTLARPPSTVERKFLTDLHKRQVERYRAKPDDATALLKTGLHPVAENTDPAELAALTAVARAILNLHETITRL